ncbi:phospholipid-transporting atpase [Anaeramoeba ignava]|uniref:Phospholipid-transporting ATPase n=1 Tax=Anaeramoeba ignava TaxID=1746090 RepID=A0A9Q0LCJ2_ANAIG|nr:phospholipid-transporting atpase [Anaeramoeba ignava]
MSRRRQTFFDFENFDKETKEQNQETKPKKKNKIDFEIKQQNKKHKNFLVSFAQFFCCKSQSTTSQQEQKQPRTITFPQNTQDINKFPANVIKNQKYNLFTFFPWFFYDQFKYFFNLYFLLTALSQFIPSLKIGFTSTYITPLVFVLTVSCFKEAYDDFQRFRRDKEANSQVFEKINFTSKDSRFFDSKKKQKTYSKKYEQAKHKENSDQKSGKKTDKETEYSTMLIPSSEIKVGDLIRLYPNQRVPADMVLLRTTEKSGASFIRTDQLDGETDWKLRRAFSQTQSLEKDEDVLDAYGRLIVDSPIKDIHNFSGTFYIKPIQQSRAAYINQSNTKNIERDDNIFSDEEHLEYQFSIGKYSPNQRLKNDSDDNKVEIQILESESDDNFMITFIPRIADDFTAKNNDNDNGDNLLDGDILNENESSHFIPKIKNPKFKKSTIQRNPESNTKIEQDNNDNDLQSFPLGIDNTLWANTVIASGTVIGVVLYTGKDTRSVMNTNVPRTKIGKLDLEINHISKLLFILMIFLSIMMMFLKGFHGDWVVYSFRFFILFCSIIPISLKVNLDIAKTYFSHCIEKDKKIPETIARTSMIPEELGRIQLLFTDKTGTLTKNDMVFKKLCLGSNNIISSENHEQNRKFALHCFSSKNIMDDSKEKEITINLESSESEFESINLQTIHKGNELKGNELKGNELNGNKLNGNELNENELNENSDLEIEIEDYQENFARDVLYTQNSQTQFINTILAIALCHNVSVVSSDEDETLNSSTGRNYQASSPDEVALIKFAESLGIILQKRTTKSMQLTTPAGETLEYDILNIFPFTSKAKRMGIIVKNRETKEIIFYIKGADVAIEKLINPSHWLTEQCENFSREGLRTLVYARRIIEPQEYADFSKNFHEARISIQDREKKIESVVSQLENSSKMELLSLTGVEDKLQDGVRETLELLTNAGIKIWMLTGDKVETAICIGISSHLISRNQSIFRLIADSEEQTFEKLNQFSRFQMRNAGQTSLVIDGLTLQFCLDNFSSMFVDLALSAPTVICSRCSPTQKAEIVKLISKRATQRTCAVGDGGNDVSMINEADVGVGIVGKEGMQASLAADYSINQFNYLPRLILWHGAHSYKKSARLAQFVIHRGLVISVIQAVFSSLFYFSPLPIFCGYLVAGYSTIFTVLPVISLILDYDTDERIVFSFPELYRETQKGRALSKKTFFTWVFIAIYQGSAIMLISVIVFENMFLHLMAITFTSLIITEWIMVALEIKKWHTYMIYAELISVAVYIFSMFMLKNYFDMNLILSINFLWKVSSITLVSCLPLYLVKLIQNKYNPSLTTKLMYENFKISTPHLFKIKRFQYSNYTQRKFSTLRYTQLRLK